MKKEDLFYALGDVGEDLLQMAEEKKFGTPWKRWVPLAACLAVVITFGALSLPKFSDKAAVQREMPTADMDYAVEESAVEDYAEAKEAPVEEEAPAEPQLATGHTEGEEAIQFVVCNTYYYVRSNVTITGEPGELGDYLGDITEADDESLIGCAVYKELYSAEFSNHAVDNQVVSQNVYVKTADGWLYAMTGNEKTVSRYTTWDIENAIYNDDEQWILSNFVQPIEAQNICLLEGSCDSDCYNKLFLASLQLNTGVMLDFPWMQEDGSLLVHPDDVRQRLRRFLDDVSDYAPEETENYDPESGMLRFSQEDYTAYAEGLYLKRVSVEGDMVWLWVGLPETDDLYDEKIYEIRFEEDGWRYINIGTPG